jgi:uncharacterized protein DUF4349
MTSSGFDRIVPFKSPTLWKGVGLGAGTLILLLFVMVPSLMRSGGAFKTASPYRMSMLDAGRRGDPETVQADAPRIVYKAELELRVANCADTLKKIEALATAESGFLESSSLEETSARVVLRVPSARLDAVRAKLRELAILVRQDGLTAADVSKQYIDREAGLRNLRAQEQQFLEIMKKARSVADVLAVTKELSRVRGEIENDDAEFRHLKNQIDMAQINVRLTSEAAAARWAPGASAKSAVNDLVQSFATFGDFLIWLVINLPLIVLWAATVFLLAAGGWYMLRRAARLMRWMFGKKASATSSTPSA